MKLFPCGKYEALLRCMKRDPKGSHVFLPKFWAKKIPAATGGEAEDFSGFCAGFSDRPKKKRKAIIILLTEDFSMVWRKRQNKNEKRLRFPCRNSPTLNCAVPSSRDISG